MEFKTLEKAVAENAAQYGKKYGVKIDKNFAVLKFFEEAGEMAQAFLIHDRKSRPEKFLTRFKSKQKLAEEMADVLGMLMLCANLLGVELEQALKKKWLKKPN